MLSTGNSSSLVIPLFTMKLSATPLLQAPASRSSNYFGEANDEKTWRRSEIKTTRNDMQGTVPVVVSSLSRTASYDLLLVDLCDGKKDPSVLRRVKSTN